MNSLSKLFTFKCERPNLERATVLCILSFASFFGFILFYCAVLSAVISLLILCCVRLYLVTHIVLLFCMVCAMQSLILYCRVSVLNIYTEVYQSTVCCVLQCYYVTFTDDVIFQFIHSHSCLSALTINVYDHVQILGLEQLG